MPTQIPTQSESGCMITMGIVSHRIGGDVRAAYEQWASKYMAYLAVTSDEKPPRRTRQPKGSKQATGDDVTSTGSTRGRGRPRKTSSDTKRPSGLGALVLEAIPTTGATKAAITASAALKAFRPNHVGLAVSRHIKAGRVVERNGVLYPAHITEQRAAA